MGSDLDATVERLSEPAPFFRLWQWIVGWIVIGVIFATFIFTAFQLYQQRQDQFRQKDAECARQILSNYEDKRDEIIKNIDNPQKLAEAVADFRQFELHDGKVESRAARTKRVC